MTQNPSLFQQLTLYQKPDPNKTPHLNSEHYMVFKKAGLHTKALVNNISESNS